MKIGVITFWTTKDNYGQTLQYYALQTYLEKCGCDVFLIKFSPRKPFVKRMKIFIVSHLLRKKYLSIDRDFKGFREKYFHTINKVYNSWKELDSNPPVVDCYVCGSDQVWNPVDYPDKNVKPWFLDFGSDKIRRVSYAASFGQSDFSQNVIDFIEPMLAKLDAVSVRETTGIQICKKANRKDAITVLDPTFLLDADDYIKISDKIDYHRPFIVGYFLNIGTEFNSNWKVIKEYIELEEKEFKVIPSHQVETFIPNEEYFYPTIPQWINTYYKADEIFTTSFHGVVFALIFHRPFMVFLLNNKGGKMNDRIFSLLNILNLEDRIFDANICLHKQIKKKIDWFAVDEKINVLRENSKIFIENKIINQK